VSTIRVDNFGPSAGGTSYSARGIAKAWVFFNEATPAIISSLNVSSFTDTSTGRGSINFTNSMSSANDYIASVTSNYISSGENYLSGIIDDSSQTRSASSFIFRSVGVSPTYGILYDTTRGNVEISGDLA
jgi:hypothetical protein